MNSNMALICVKYHANFQQSLHYVNINFIKGFLQNHLSQIFKFTKKITSINSNSLPNVTKLLYNITCFI